MSSEKTRKKIALFIDSENVSYKFLEDIFKHLDEMGEVCVKKAYGDWRREAMRGWDEVLRRYSIEPIHIITGSVSKSNSSDIRIAIDVMHTLYEGKMECIALATSDSDFAPLAQEIRTKGVESIGFGEQKSREDLRNAFSRFYELVSNKKIENEKKNPVQDIKDIENSELQILKDAVGENLESNGWARLSMVGSHLRNQYKKTPAHYGRANWIKVFSQYPLHFSTRYEGTIAFVSLKKQQLQEKQIEENLFVEKCKKICNFFGFTH